MLRAGPPCLSLSLSLAGQRALFCHILQHHVDVVIEAAQRADELLVTTHDNVQPRPDAFVDELCTRAVGASISRYSAAMGKCMQNGIKLAPSGST